MTDFFLTIDVVAPLLEHVKEAIVRLPGALITLFVSYCFLKLIQAIVAASLRRTKITKPMQGILLSVLSVVLWVGLFSLVFQSLGLNQIAIAISSSLAVIAIGVATGANKVVADISAGVYLARSNDFKIGRQVKIGDLEGQIYSLDSRKVRILKKDDTLAIVPNSKFDELVWEVPKGE
ncbi:MAG TPA: mechanosensitive ion channel domain-containing protein [Patescibacteria group bacterium]